MVQAVWERMDLQCRLVLRAEYPARDGAARPAAAARLGLTLDRYELVLAAGVGNVKDAIDAVGA
ncbi:hypothetical protein ASE76_07430 [Xylophilus sp. Leaf220]|nr:hypothetical protein ASE76_07430 [Xylophilus sp. Leaf220]